MLAMVVGLLLGAVLLGQHTPLRAQEPEPEPPAGASVGGLRLSGVPGSLVDRASDSFSVDLRDLVTALVYTVHVSRDSASLGIGACGTGTATRTVTGVNSQSLTFTLRACRPGSGTVTAELRRAGLSHNEDSDSKRVTVTALPPGPVQGLTGNTPSSNSIHVSWKAPSNSGSWGLTGYHVQHKRSGEGWPQGSDIVKGKTSHTISHGNIRPRTGYDVRVQACNGVCGAWKSVNVTTPPDSSPPEPVRTPKPRTVTAPGPVQELNVDGRHPPSLHVTWKAPSDNGGRSLTGYHVQHKRSGEGWPQGSDIVKGKTNHTVSHSNLRANTKYDVRVQACNGECGAWEEKLGVQIPSAPPPHATKPHQVGPLSIQGGDRQLIVRWSAPNDGGAPITAYKVAWPGHETSVGKNERSYTITGLTNGSKYAVKVRACNAKGCGDWSLSATGTPALGPTTVANPAGLEVIPLSQRRVEVRWQPIAGATRYNVEATHNPTNVIPSWRSIGSLTDGSTKLTIYLDSEFSPSGSATIDLADHEAYGLRVKTTITGRPSATSDTIIVVDNPIASVNGNSKNTEDGLGRAVVRWPKISGATAYTILYRKLPGDHWNPGWTIQGPSTSLPRTAIEVAAASARVDPSDSTMLMQSIGGTKNSGHRLERYKIYGVSINYLKGAVQYVAAREAYVWPSDRAADGGERVATFPLTRRLSNKTYEYHICGDTFVPAGKSNARRKAWITLVETALEQWQTATGGMITVDPASEPCANYDVTVSQIEGYVRKKRMDVPGIFVSDLREHVRKFMEALRNTGAVRSTSSLSTTRNEIFMYNDVDGPNAYFFAHEVFPEIAADLGYRCWYDEDGNYQYGVKMCMQPTLVAGNWRSDIVVRRSAYENAPQLVVPAHNARFNTCRNGADDKDSDDNLHSAFEDMMHEAGHALGIAGGRQSGWVSKGHPQVADSVMNYDWRAAAKNPRVPPVAATDFNRHFEERDCGPHPLDVMAIYALYQTE